MYNMCSMNIENNKSIPQEQISCFQMSNYSSSLKAIEWLRLQYLLSSFLFMLLLLNFFQIAICFAKHGFKLCSLLLETYSGMSILCCSQLNLTVANCLYSIKFIHLLLYLCFRSSLSSSCFTLYQFFTERYAVRYFALFWFQSYIFDKNKSVQ